MMQNIRNSRNDPEGKTDYGRPPLLISGIFSVATLLNNGHYEGEDSGLGPIMVEIIKALRVKLQN